MIRSEKSVRKVGIARSEYKIRKVDASSERRVKTFEAATVY